MHIKNLLATFTLGALLSTSSFAATALTPIENDGDIIAHVLAIDTHEVNAAKIALDKHPQADVVNYAHEMINDHSKNIEDMKSISISQNIPLQDTSSLEKFVMQGKKSLDKLEMVDTKHIDKTYMNDMVKGHEQALSLLNSYIQDANNPKLKDLLKATQEAVNSHLVKAKEIQAQLKG